MNPCGWGNVGHPKRCSRCNLCCAWAVGDPQQPPSTTPSRVLEQGSSQLLRDAWEKVKNLFCVFPKKPSLQETAYCEQDSAFSAEPELGCGHWHWEGGSPAAGWKAGMREGGEGTVTGPHQCRGSELPPKLTTEVAQMGTYGLEGWTRAEADFSSRGKESRRNNGNNKIKIS